MAIVKMSKLRLIGLKKDADAVMDTVTKSRLFELEPTYARPGLSARLSPGLTEKYLAEQARLGFAIEYLERQSDRVKAVNRTYGTAIVPLNAAKVRENVKCDSLFEIISERDELIGVTEALEKLSFEEVALRSEIAELDGQIGSLNAYYNLNLKFSCARQTKRAAVLIALTNKTVFDLKKLDDLAYYQLFPLSKVSHALALACLKDNLEQVKAVLNENGFELCPFSVDMTAKEMLEKLNAKRRNLVEQADKTVMRALAYAEYDFRLKLLYDYYGVRQEQNGAAAGVGRTEYTFVLEGWTPAAEAERLFAAVKTAAPGIFGEILEEEEGDEPPTLTRNNGFVSPFEDLTEMYTVPAYHESDPNPIMSFWYFLLFGIMTGDVVYGILLSLVCFLLPRFKKMEKGMRNLVKMFFWCGFSSAFWGLLYGSFVGLSIPLAGSLPFLSYESGGKIFLGWFNPIDKPMILMGLSLLLGILQLACGYLLKFIACVKERKIIDGLCEGILPIAVLAAIGLLGFEIFAGIFVNGVLSLEGGLLPAKISSVLSTAGLITLAVAVGLIFLTAGRHAKNVLGYIGSGFNGIYGLINLVSDIFSYFRLFGLGLAGAAISLAFNTLIQTLFFAGGHIVAMIIGVLVAALLHVFNLAIGVLGAYVHDARLQFLEFYGKFLTGEGRLFTPLGENTKYTVLS